MWSRAAVLDRSVPELGTTAQKTSKLPNITAHVMWESFASITVWVPDCAQSCSDVERQLTNVDVVKRRSLYADTAEIIIKTCSEAKYGCAIIGRGDHALLMCMKVILRDVQTD